MANDIVKKVTSNGTEMAVLAILKQRPDSSREGGWSFVSCQRCFPECGEGEYKKILLDGPDHDDRWDGL
mgnify:CR=1 FL=1